MRTMVLLYWFFYKDLSCPFDPFVPDRGDCIHNHLQNPEYSLEKSEFTLLPASICMFDLTPNKQQLETNLSWRAEKDMAAALRSEPWEVFGCATEGKFEELCKSYYPHFTLGTDRLGRPVLVQKARPVEVVSLKTVFQVVVWNCDEI